VGSDIGGDWALDGLQFSQQCAVHFC